MHLEAWGENWRLANGETFKSIYLLFQACRDNLGTGNSVVLLILQANADMRVNLDVPFSTACTFAEVKWIFLVLLSLPDHCWMS